MKLNEMKTNNSYSASNYRWQSVSVMYIEREKKKRKLTEEEKNT